MWTWCRTKSAMISTDDMMVSANIIFLSLLLLYFVIYNSYFTTIDGPADSSPLFSPEPLWLFSLARRSTRELCILLASKQLLSVWSWFRSLSVNHTTDRCELADSAVFKSWFVSRLYSIVVSSSHFCISMSFVSFWYTFSGAASFLYPLGAIFIYLFSCSSPILTKLRRKDVLIY